MANRKKRKQPIDGAWFKRVCSQRGMSMNGLAKVAGWSSRQIRDGVNHGEMTPELLSSCARALNVHPAYLAGKYGWTLKLEIMKDAEVREHWLKTAMAPDAHPYAYSQQEEIDLYRHFCNSLLLHGIERSEFMRLEHKEQEIIGHELDQAVTEVLKKHFPEAQKGAWAARTFEDSFQDEADVVDAMFDWLEAHGKISVERQAAPDSQAN